MKKVIKITMIAISVVAVVGLGASIAAESRNTQEQEAQCYNQCIDDGASPNTCESMCYAEIKEPPQ